MRVIGRDKLIKFSTKHNQAKAALNAWFAEAERANWQTPKDIKENYRSADFLSANRVIFNIKGNHYRLVIKVRYENGIVVIQWVGTHAEYDRQRL